MLPLLGVLAARTCTLTPRRCAATSALAMPMSLNVQVVILIEPLLVPAAPYRSRLPPQVLLMVLMTLVRMAYFSRWDRLG